MNNNNHAVAPPLKESQDEFFNEDRPYTLNPLEQYLREIGRVPLITKEREIELAKRIKNGDEVARHEMITANLRLVVTIAKKYQGMGLQFLDLINEGNIGLMKAVERFNPKKGGKLSTYSRFWIKQTILLALGNQSRDIRLPINLIQKISCMKRAESKLQIELERLPTNEEIAERLDIDVEKVKQMRSANVPPLQLDSPVENGNDRTLADLIPDNRAKDPAENSAKDSELDRMESFLCKLPECDQTILRLRFGLDDGGDGLNLYQISEIFGVTRERIRQIQAQALHRLNALMNDKCYRKPQRKIKKM